MKTQIRKFYEQQLEAFGPQALAADEAFASLVRIATARGLPVMLNERAEELVTSIFEFLMDSNTDESRPMRFRLQRTVDGGTVLRAVK